jgi:preprotein translocase subunit SecG
MKRILTLVLTVFVAVLASPSGAFACAACFGQSDSNMAKSVNAGIFSLMAVLATVLIGAASFFVFLSRRANAVETGKAGQDTP